MKGIMRPFLYRFAKRFASPDFSGYLEARAVGTSGLEQQASSIWVSEGNPATRAVALTFDDGPTPGVTGPILDAFARVGGHGTFFQVGECVQQAPELTLRAHREGHEIGNHTMTHCRSTTLDDEALKAELESCSAAIENVIGQKPTWFRSPFSAFREEQSRIPKALGMRIAFWNSNPRDWKHPGTQVIVENVKRLIHPGAIIVMHDKHPQTAEAIGPIVDFIYSQGLTCRTFSELAG